MTRSNNIQVTPGHLSELAHGSKVPVTSASGYRFCLGLLSLMERAASVTGASHLHRIGSKRQERPFLLSVSLSSVKRTSQQTPYNVSPQLLLTQIGPLMLMASVGSRPAVGSPARVGTWHRGRPATCHHREGLVRTMCTPSRAGRCVRVRCLL